MQWQGERAARDEEELWYGLRTLHAMSHASQSGRGGGRWSRCCGCCYCVAGSLDGIDIVAVGVKKGILEAEW